MNALARSLAFLAIAAQVGLGVASAYASSDAIGAGASDQAPMRLAQSSPGNGNGGGGPAPGHDGGAGVSLPHFDSPAPAAASCSALDLPDPNSFATALEGLEEISKKTQDFIAHCDCNTQACIADALDKYADAVAKVAPRLPPAFRKLPAVIHAAAQKARVAPTPRAAVKVLIAAVALVHKTVALMRASDPDAKAVATRGGDAVAETLKVAATTLARADQL